MYKLLIVDDEIIETEALTHITKHSNLPIKHIETAYNGKQAINVASSFHPDIIVMDVKMPGINGIDAAKEIKKMLPRTRILFLTAFASFDYAQHALRLGAEDFIVKPVSKDNYLKTISMLLEKIEKDELINKNFQTTKLKYQQISCYFEEELISYIAFNNIDEDQIKEYFSVLDIPITEGFCSIIDLNEIILDKSNSKLQTKIIFKKILRKSKELLGTKFHYILGHPINNCIYVLILSEADYYHNIYTQNILKNLQTFIYNNYLLTACIGVSNPFKALSQITTSFQEARIALNYTNKNELITYYDSIELHSSYLHYPLDQEKKLCEQILLADEKKVIPLALEILDWICSNFEDRTLKLEKIYSLLLIVYKTVDHELNTNFSVNNHLIKNLWSIENKETMRTYLKNNLTHLLNNITLIKKQNKNTLVDELCLFIQEHYMEDISLNTCADKVGLSGHYLSKLFKAEKNMNFIEYLTIIRIKQAKHLLHSSKKSIKEITFLIGYKDPNYFNRVFKRVEGITPLAYRNSIS
ncbi:response regulator [Clostridium sp. DL1XJH146]